MRSHEQESLSSPAPLDGEKDGVSDPLPRRRRLLLGSSFFLMLVVALGLVAYIILQARYNMRVMRLFDAARDGDVATVERLLHSGVSANQRDVRWSYQTVLMCAAQAGRADVIRVLLKHDAKVDATYEGLDQNNGRTALMFAAESPANFSADSNAFQELLSHGAKINARDAFGQTALIMAIHAKQRSAIEYLLDHGADPTVRNSFGQPAVTLAIENGLSDMAILLLTKGADINAIDYAEPTAMLKRKGRKGFDEIPVAWNTSTNLNTTPLMAAVNRGNRELVKSLINRGADVNIRDKQGITPLALATRSNYVEIVQILRAAGAKE